MPPSLQLALLHRTRLLHGVAGFAAAAGLLAAAAAPAQAADPSTFRTGFEVRNGSSFTTLAEEQSFLRGLDDGSSRVAVAEIGRTTRDRPLQLVTVGPPRAKADIAAGSSVLFVCTQHGTEPAGREACLQRIREHAVSSSTDTLLFIPTANPDGVAVGSRANANGTDINRDHLHLGTREARAIAATMRDYKPDLLGDMHEYQASGASSVQFHSPTGAFPNADSAITALSSQLNRNYLVPDVRAAGFVTGDYPPAHDERILRSMTGLRHIVGALVETPRLGTLSPLRRVSAQRAAMSAILRMFRERRAELATTTAAAAQRVTAEGAAGNQRLYFTAGSSTTAPPCGYRLTDAQYQSRQLTLALHGVAATRSGTDWIVSLAQPAQPVLPLLLDSRAMYDEIAARTLSCPLTQPTAPTPTPTPTPTPSPSTRTATLGAVADTTTYAKPSTQTRTEVGTVRVDTSDWDVAGARVHGHLKFEVPALAASERITAARLSLHVTDGAANGPRVFRTAAGWAEGSLTWGTLAQSAPRSSSTPVGDFGAIATGARSFVSLTGIAGGGPVAFELDPDDNDTARFASREAGTAATRPQLVLTIQAG